MKRIRKPRGSKARAGVPPDTAGPVIVTRRAHFNAAHRLHNPSRSAAWNKATYGECNHPNWHGHNYELEVSVIGLPAPENGYVMDLGKLRDIVQEEIVEPCDHRNLNLDVPFLSGVIPSAENLAVAFWNRIAPKIRGGRLWRLRLFETPRNWADYYGPSGPSLVLLDAPNPMN